jgi:hypothetical protein
MRLVIFLMGWIAWWSTPAQVSVAEFLRSAEDDPQVRSFDSQVDYLNSKPYRLSPLQKMEFRTQNRELLAYQQEYALRLNAANPWEIRNNSRYFLAYRDKISLEQELVFKEALLTRYNLVVMYVYRTRVKALAQVYERLLNEQVNVLEQLSGSSYFDADEYAKLKVAVIDKAIEYEEAGFDLENLRNEVNLLYPAARDKTLNWEVEELISPEEIERVIDSLAVIAFASRQLAYQQQKIELANREYALEKSNFNLGFLQTEFDHRRVVQERTPVNLSFGITLPVVNPNKGDMAKRRLDAIEAEHDFREVQSHLETSVDASLDKLKGAIERYRVMKLRMEEMLQSDLPHKLSMIKGSDPLVMLEFEVSRVKLRLLEAKQERNILLHYVSYLAVTDKLIQRPLANYLTRTLKPVGE